MLRIICEYGWLFWPGSEAFTYALRKQTNIINVINVRAVLVCIITLPCVNVDSR